MIEHLPTWIELLFLIAVIDTIGLFYLANKKPFKIILVVLVLALIQSLLAFNGFYQDTSSTPPTFIFAIFPSLILVVFGLMPKQMAWVIKNRDIRISTFLHTVRVLIEVVLYFLFIHHMIPELMTFEGRNFDILAGFSALLVFILFNKKLIGNKLLLLWNIIGLTLVLFIAINGVLSAELPIQLFAFDQPNRALLYFPFILLPSIVVPIVIYTHISDILILKNRINDNSDS